MGDPGSSGGARNLVTCGFAIATGDSTMTEGPTAREKIASRGKPDSREATEAQRPESEATATCVATFGPENEVEGRSRFPETRPSTCGFQVVGDVGFEPTTPSASRYVVLTAQVR